MASSQNLIVKLVLSAKDEASGIFDSFKAKAGAVAAAVAAYFSVDFLAGSVKSAANFEAAMSRVQAATGAAGAELAQLKKAAEDASLGSKFTSVEAAQGLENLAKAGLNAKESLAALPGVLALAEAGDISLGESATYVTRTIAGLGVAVEDTGRIADVLAKGANASNTSVKGLAEALSYAAPSARSLGLSLEQTVAIIGKFADAGIDASRAGTALNSILSQFKDPASKFREELVSAGITTSKFDLALRQLAGAGEKGEKAILAVGQEAGPALRGLLNQGIGALDDLKSKLDAAKGSAAETAAIMGANLNGATSALGKTWEALTIKLGEPVLPAVTQAVKDLTAGLQGAISNGTATRFGEALRSAFASAAEWARKFAAEVDPVALTAKLQETASKVGAWFDAVSEGARNAGDIVRTAYGVMSGGVNVVMASIYKLGEVFSIIAASLLKDFSLIASGLSKITFGGMSEGFKAAAEEIRISAIGMVGVATEYGRKSSEAFDAAASSAELARKGWAGLTSPAEQAAVAVQKAGEAARVTADDLDKAGEGATVAGGKITALGNAGTAAAPGVKAVGDAAKGTAASTADAAAAADRLKAAYQALGLESAAALREAAAKIKGHYEAIKADGTATPAILEAAFKKYAEAAIAANSGIAPASLKAEASIRGVRIEADETGKSIVKIGTAAQAAAQGVQTNMRSAAAEINKVRSDAEKLADRLQSLKNQELGDSFGNQSSGNGTFEDLRKAGVTAEQMKNMGYSSREIEDYVTRSDQAAPGTVNRTVTTSTTDNYARGIELGLTSDQAKVFATALSDEITRANVEARGKAQATNGVAFGVDDYVSYQRQAETKALETARRSNQKDAANSTEMVNSNFYGSTRTVTVNLNINGKNTQVQVANQSAADALVRALQDAASAQS
jgi:TP901 family phage tail tape measure protein